MTDVSPAILSDVIFELIHNPDNTAVDIAEALLKLYRIESHDSTPATPEMDVAAYNMGIAEGLTRAMKIYCRQ